MSSVIPGKTITVLWRGKPVFIRRRTQDEIADARAVKHGRIKTILKKMKIEQKIKDEWLSNAWGLYSS